MYKQTAIYGSNGTQIGVRDNQVQRLADNAFIPFDRDNRDYVEYLEWLEAGNTPLPADEQGEQNV